MSDETTSNDPDPVEPAVEEAPQPAVPQTPTPDVPSEEEGSETSVDTTVVSHRENDPTHSAQPGDESGLDLDDLVQQIFEGKWDSGQQRRNRLSAAGYDFREVEEAVVARMNVGRNG